MRMSIAFPPCSGLRPPGPRPLASILRYDAMTGEPDSLTAPLLIDTDPGIDDALALLLAWSSPGVRVEAITTVAGNVPLDRGTTNVFRLIDLRRPVPVPLVAEGAAQPLARPLTTATRYHGEDGLGDLSDWPPTPPRVALQRAGPVIADTARRLGRRLTLVALGPLTNIALALAADPTAVSAAGRIVAMGGEIGRA